MYLKRTKFLIADPHQHMRGILRHILQTLGGWDIVLETDEHAVIDAIRLNEPDVAFLDHTPGVMNGIGIVRQLRDPAHSPMPYLPVIVCSAHANLRRVVDARNAGANEFLAKPFSPKAVSQRLHEVLERPRPFVELDHYFGPCRRRHFADEYVGRMRRADDTMRRRQQDPLERRLSEYLRLM